MEIVRRCKYRNCCKIVEGRKDKKFCSKNCRSQEAVYEMRDRKRFFKDKKDINELISRLVWTRDNNMDDETLNLYKKLYK